MGNTSSTIFCNSIFVTQVWKYSPCFCFALCFYFEIFSIKNLMAKKIVSLLPNFLTYDYWTITLLATFFDLLPKIEPLGKNAHIFINLGLNSSNIVSKIFWRLFLLFLYFKQTISIAFLFFFNQVFFDLLSSWQNLSANFGGLLLFKFTARQIKQWNSWSVC